jgi:hypothetical protein
MHLCHPLDSNMPGKENNIIGKMSRTQRLINLAIKASRKQLSN